MKRESIFLWKVVLIGAAAIIVLAWLFFNFTNMVIWMSFNNPFQGQWAVVQLTDGEILYGHLHGVNGSTIGLTDVYLLDKVTPEPAAPAVGAPQGVASSTDLSLTGGAVPAAAPAQPVLVPVSDTPQLFINRAAVVYFKFVTPDDPALPYLH